MTDSQDPASDTALPLRTGALLLDMDGTLIDSGPAVERSWNTLLRELGTDLRFDHAHHGMPARRILAQILPEASEAELDAAHRRIEELEMQDVEGIVVLPGTERLLAELDAAAETLGRRGTFPGRRLAILSNGGGVGRLAVDFAAAHAISSLYRAANAARSRIAVAAAPMSFTCASLVFVSRSMGRVSGQVQKI